MSDTEQALVEIVARAHMLSEPPFEGCEWGDLDIDDVDRIYYLDRAMVLVAALRDALPRGTVLTADGLAESVLVGRGKWEGYELWAREDEPPSNPQDWFPLFTLTPEDR